jgi:hypothetical protein
MPSLDTNSTVPDEGGVVGGAALQVGVADAAHVLLLAALAYSAVAAAIVVVAVGEGHGDDGRKNCRRNRAQREPGAAVSRNRHCSSYQWERPDLFLVQGNAGGLPISGASARCVSQRVSSTVG